MTPTDPIALLIHHFPELRRRIEEDDLLTSPHIAYSLLATEVLRNSADNELMSAVAHFINYLSTSGDSLLEELLVIDVLEGIAQNADVANSLRKKIDRKATAFLELIERELLKRNSHCDGLTLLASSDTADDGDVGFSSSDGDCSVISSRNVEPA